MRLIYAPVFLLLSAASAVAGGPDWRGTYEPFSRGCIPDRIIVRENTLRYGNCLHSIVERLANTRDELTVLVASTSKCGWSGTVISLRKVEGSEAVQFYNYKSREDWAAGRHQAYCAYGPRQ